MVRKIYSGIGSRNTPPSVLILMAKWAQYLGQSGFTLRSGGAFGADSAFENGCDSVNGVKQIYTAEHAKYRQDWRLHASQFHPAWKNCTAGMQLLHARNSPIILGGSLLEPSDFVLCWTPDGAVKGGTGQGLRIAEAAEIPIFNFWQPEQATAALQEWLRHAK